MFTTADVTLVLRKLALSIEEDDGGELQRLCETTFRVPLLSASRAKDIHGVTIARHCFGRDDLALWDVNDVHFTPPTLKFTISVRTAPDAPDLLTIPLAVITKIRVWRAKKDRRDLSLEFVTQHELLRGDVRDLAALMLAWEARTVSVTFAQVQLPLDLEEEDAPDVRYRDVQ